eukprot:NODE_135_length_3554_cov_5.035308.p1 GENE.NODE_135_length_3554_cov_5.035308~~NODE_135_length_3554_cov_5.035308.p1  ORF type:complete len:1100 (-),score=298.73 NODE_135_length_3554_cov_5.035308:255-3362(-)
MCGSAQLLTAALKHLCKVSSLFGEGGNRDGGNSEALACSDDAPERTIQPFYEAVMDFNETVQPPADIDQYRAASNADDNAHAKKWSSASAELKRSASEAFLAAVKQLQGFDRILAIFLKHAEYECAMIEDATDDAASAAFLPTLKKLVDGSAEAMDEAVKALEAAEGAVTRSSIMPSLGPLVEPSSSESDFESGLNIWGLLIDWDASSLGFRRLGYSSRLTAQGRGREWLPHLFAWCIASLDFVGLDDLEEDGCIKQENIFKYGKFDDADSKAIAALKNIESERCEGEHSKLKTTAMERAAEYNEQQKKVHGVYVRNIENSLIKPEEMVKLRELEARQLWGINLGGSLSRTCKAAAQPHTHWMRVFVVWINTCIKAFRIAELECKLLPLTYVPALAPKVKLILDRSEVMKMYQHIMEQFEAAVAACAALMASTHTRLLIAMVLEILMYVKEGSGEVTADDGFSFMHLEKIKGGKLKLGSWSFASVLCAFLRNQDPVFWKKLSGELEPCNPAKLSGWTDLTQALACFDGLVNGVLQLATEDQLFGPEGWQDPALPVARYAQGKARMHGRQSLHRVIQEFEKMQETLKQQPARLADAQKLLCQYAAVKEEKQFTQILEVVRSFVDELREVWSDEKKVSGLISEVQFASTSQIIFMAPEAARAKAFEHWRAQATADKGWQDWSGHAKKQSIKACFDLFDTQGNYRITVRGLQETLDAMGIADAQKAVELFKMHDADGNRTLDQEEFEHLFDTRIREVFLSFVKPEVAKRLMARVAGNKAKAVADAAAAAMVGTGTAAAVEGVCMGNKVEDSGLVRARATRIEAKIVLVDDHDLGITCDDLARVAAELNIKLAKGEVERMIALLDHDKGVADNIIIEGEFQQLMLMRQLGPPKKHTMAANFAAAQMKPTRTISQGANPPAALARVVLAAAVPAVVLAVAEMPAAESVPGAPAATAAGARSAAQVEAPADPKPAPSRRRSTVRGRSGVPRRAAMTMRGAADVPPLPPTDRATARRRRRDGGRQVRRAVCRSLERPVPPQS